MTTQEINEIFSQVHNDEAIRPDIEEGTEIQTRAAEIYSEHVTLSDADKLDYMFRRFLQLEDLLEKAEPLLEQAGPLLATFGGQAASPLGRIAGSLFR